MSKMASHEPFGHLQPKLWAKEGPGIKLAVWLPTTKSRESTWPRRALASATWRWKTLKESYQIGSDLVPIKGWGEKLWWPKVSGVQTGTVSGLHFGSPGTKSHLGVGAAEQCREYYMGEGDGFPQAQAVVSQVSPRSPVACPNTKRVQNEF
jgi:hypothetical protein